MVKYSSFNKKIVFLFLCFNLFATNIISQNISIASFSRLGFGSRGVALSNAMSSVIYGEVTGYYNPAVLPFSNLKVASLTFGILSLDRELDFLHYTQSLYPTAGFSIFLIRAGVKNIDSRDVDGYHIETLSTSEFQLGFAFSNRITEKLSVGLSLKFYYNKLYREMKTQTLGIDLGILFKLNDNITAGASIHDLNAKYKWDSSIIYQEKGRTIVETFPKTIRLGLTYAIKDIFFTSLEYDNIGKEKLLNFGSELYPLYFVADGFKQSLSIRGGVQIFRNYLDFSLGFGLSRKIGNFVVFFDYAYKFERYSPSGMQLLTLGLKL
ncbi:MAG: hypothetical protein ACK44H_02350 [Candidatus Kryptonium sp.]